MKEAQERERQTLETIQKEIDKDTPKIKVVSKTIKRVRKVKAKK